jgi:putative DNA primase/helicase
MNAPANPAADQQSPVAANDNPSAQELADLRIRLLRTGYRPVPIVGAHVPNDAGAGKRPKMPGWHTKCLTADEKTVAGWSWSQPDCTNTGILSGEIVGVDIDVLDEELSAKLVARAAELFGPTTLRRIGRAPKTLLVYRVETPHEKQSTPDLFLGGDVEDKETKAKVGIHPVTKAPYTWPEQSPRDMTASEVPVVTLELLKQFVRDAEDT